MVVFGVEALDEPGSEKHKVSIKRSAHASVVIFGAPHYRK
jgi:hypothetical protein